MKERSTQAIVFQSFRNQSASFVSEGARFHFNGRDRIFSRGPLLGPIIVFATSNRAGSEYEVEVEFTVSRQNDPLFSVQQNEWILQGWSKCSKDCGGGRQHVLFRYIAAYPWWHSKIFGFVNNFKHFLVPNDSETEASACIYILLPSVNGPYQVFLFKVRWQSKWCPSE